MKALKPIKSGKSHGNDRIASEMIKNTGDSENNLFLEIFNKVWKEEEVREDWGLIVPFLKVEIIRTVPICRSRYRPNRETRSGDK